MTRLRLLALAMLCLGLGACGTHWERPGATQADFNVDRYACMRESQGYWASASGPTQYTAGAYSAGTGTDVALFDACMNAKGYALVRNKT